jgi:2'-5' RNA ligase
VPSGAVTAVVCAALDGPADAEVRRRVAVLAAAGLRRPELRHRPHLTLAAARVPREHLEDVVAAAGQVAGCHQRVPLVLDELGSFRSGVLWVGPSDAAGLAGLQADVDAALLGAGWPRAFGERSAPGRWQPHCTLVTRLRRGDLPRARSLVDDGPVHAVVDALAVILVGGAGDAALLPLRH